MQLRSLRFQLARILIVALATSTAGCAVYDDVTKKIPEAQERNVGSYEEVAAQMDQAMQAVGAVLEHNVEGGAIKEKSQSRWGVCGPGQRLGKKYNPARMGFSAPDGPSSVPIDVASAQPVLEREIPAALAELGFSSDGPEDSRKGRLAWLFTNGNGDTISVVVTETYASFEGYTQCFRPAGRSRAAS